MSNHITVSEASRILGASSLWVRMKCEDGTLGSTYGRGLQKKHYMVSPGKLASWCGISTEEVWSQVSDLRNQ